MKKILSLIVMVSLLIMMVGCSTEAKSDTGSNTVVEETTTEVAEETKSSEEETTSSEDSPEDEMLSGDITISGSTSVEKIGVALGADFMDINGDVNVTYQGIGSSAGVKNANEGTTILGTASRNIKDAEKEWGMEEVVLCYDGIAVIFHPSNGVEGLTMEETKLIFKGEITNWASVGGEDKEIVVVSRENGSGTRGAFEEIVDFEDSLAESALIAEGNGNVQTVVAGNENAIGYVSFTYINDTIKAALIEGNYPSAEEVVAGNYPISRPFNIVYHSENVNEATQEFLEYITTDDAKDIIEEKGGIPVQ